jgi:hypothetical protein
MITKITLIPGVGIGGYEIAFKEHIPKGAVVRLLSVWRKTILFDDGVFYRVSVKGVDLSHDVPIELELYRGNDGMRVGLDLNSQFYEKLPTSAR